MREDKFLNEQQPAPGLHDGVHHTELRQVLSQDDPYLQMGSMMMKANQASTPPSASHRTPPQLVTKGCAPVNFAWYICKQLATGLAQCMWYINIYRSLSNIVIRRPLQNKRDDMTCSSTSQL